MYGEGVRGRLRAGDRHGGREPGVPAERSSTASGPPGPAGPASPRAARPGGVSRASTASIIRSSRSSLSRTCRYSDIVATPRSTATRRIETAASPSASATAIAASTIAFGGERPVGARGRIGRQPGRRGSRARRRRRGDRGRRAGWRPRRRHVPTPGTARTRPWWRSSVSALVAVAIATPHSRVISRVEGTRSPGASSPASIRSRSAAATSRYREAVDEPAIGVRSGAVPVSVLVHLRAAQPSVPALARLRIVPSRPRQTMQVH